MLLRRRLVCREGGGALVAYGTHISGKPTNQELTYWSYLRTVSRNATQTELQR
jgi:hypothetical protein